MLKEAHHHDIRFAGKKRVSEDLIKKKKKKDLRERKKKKDERIATLTSPWDLAWLSVYVQHRDSDRE